MRSNNFIALSVLILAGFLLRLYNTGSYGIWPDEEVSVLAAIGQYPEIPPHGFNFTNATLESHNTVDQVIKCTNYYDSGNAIFYNLLLHYWLKLTGSGETAARLLSVLFSLMSIVLVFILSLELFDNRRIAFFSALILALHPLNITYSQQSRTYAVSVFLSLSSTYFLFRTIKGDQKFGWYILFSLLALLSHYLTICVLIGHGLVYMIRVREKKSWLYFLLSMAAIAGLFSAWLLTGGSDGLQMMAARNARFAELSGQYMELNNTFYLPATFKNILTGWLQVWLQIFGNGLQDLQLQIRYIFFLLLVPGLLMYLSIKTSTPGQKRFQGIYMLLVMIFAQTLLATALAFSSGHCISFQPLYSNFVVPYACILIGFSLPQDHRSQFHRQTTLLGAAQISLMLVSLIPVYGNLDRRLPEQHPGEKLALQVRSELRNTDTLLLDSYGTAQLFHFFMPAAGPIHMQIDTTLMKYQFRIKHRDLSHNAKRE